jgi:hypothetical protein
MDFQNKTNKCMRTLLTFYQYKYLSNIKLIALQGDNVAFAQLSKYKQGATCHSEADILRGIAVGNLPVFTEVMKQLEHRRHQVVGPMLGYNDFNNLLMQTL